MYVCMYVRRDIYVRAAAYSLDCHGDAMIYRRLHKTFQSLVEHRTESRDNDESRTVSGSEFQSMRSFAVHSSWSYSNWRRGILSLLNANGSLN